MNFRSTPHSGSVPANGFFVSPEGPIPGAGERERMLIAEAERTAIQAAMAKAARLVHFESPEAATMRRRARCLASPIARKRLMEIEAKERSLLSMHSTTKGGIRVARAN